MKVIKIQIQQYNIDVQKPKVCTSAHKSKERNKREGSEKYEGGMRLTILYMVLKS